MLVPAVPGKWLSNMPSQLGLRSLRLSQALKKNFGRQFVIDRYAIPEDHALCSRDATFAKQIKRGTVGRGVDVVLNFLGGELLRHSWSCIAPLRRFIELGKRDIYGNGQT